MSNIFLRAQLIHNGFSYVKENVLEITEAGEIVDLHEHTMLPDSINFEQVNGILCPGFVNVHCHTELSAMQDFIPEKTGLVNFLFSIWKNREQASEIEKSISIAEALEHMEEEGIVAVGDICNTLDSLEAKKNSSLFFHNFYEVTGFDPEVANTRFEAIKKIKEDADKQNLKNCVSSITPHAPYSTSPVLMQKILDYNKDLISIHNQETVAENHLFRKKEGDFLEMYKQMEISIDFFEARGKNSLESTIELLSEAKKTIFVHDTYSTADDIELMKKSMGDHFALCLCPLSNLYIEDTLPDVYTMVEHYSDQICLGTDSLASNHQMSILAEIRCLLDHYSNIDLELALRYATINGAKALNIDEQFGSFVKGKKPGVLCIQDEQNVKRLY